MLQPSPSPEIGMLERKVILIVEDDPEIGAFLVQFFQGETPHYILHARDANQVLEMVRSLIPDLLVVDYWLPQMNGLELYDRLEGTNELQHIPVLFMSATHPLRALQERHLPFLKKPFEVDTLLQTVENLLPRDFHWLE